MGYFHTFLEYFFRFRVAILSRHIEGGEAGGRTRFFHQKLQKFINFGWHTPFFLSSPPPPLFEFLVSSSSCTCSFLLYPCILQNMLHMYSYSEGSPYSKYIAVFCCIAAMGMSTQYVILPLTYLPHYFSAIFLHTHDLRTHDG